MVITYAMLPVVPADLETLPHATRVLDGTRKHADEQPCGAGLAQGTSVLLIFAAPQSAFAGELDDLGGYGVRLCEFRPQKCGNRHVWHNSPTGMRWRKSVWRG
jgi:hypothetical protein